MFLTCRRSPARHEPSAVDCLQRHTGTADAADAKPSPGKAQASVAARERAGR
ncbi:hypothetical protein DM02DRAFT_609616 [Periconia macrospinosa]|uniref:Uncharacterized protein n=1 Tax=Periconia macrospinosa TaxID=97972 RepID=A0A2V1EC39_9PLEO|nr:hypothetical protein DM02DRAFT_609616 [Periconia macrospinosa]